MTSGPISAEQLIEAAAILMVIALMLGAIGAIVVNEMRRRGDRRGDE